MADTAIEWAEKVWNPTTGCDRVSPGCDNCYALTLAKRLKGMGAAKYQTDGDPRTSGPGFGVSVHEDALNLPLTWRNPKRIFVNSMSDLFHDQVPDEFIARVWAVMAATPQHTYQILTKRHARMRALLRDECRCGAGHPAGTHLMSAIEWAATSHNPSYVPGLSVHAVREAIRGMTWGKVLPNVWLGVSVEDQKWADIRIPVLLDTPAAVRWLSCEPLLGPVDLAGYLPRPAGAAWYPVECRHGHGGCPVCDRTLAPEDAVSWVVAGGESGPGARPMHPDWPRILRDQCTEAGVPFFFKQWGEWDPIPPADGQAPFRIVPEYGHDKDGPFTKGWAMRRVGKRAAGRMLDGRTWGEYPAQLEGTPR